MFEVALLPTPLVLTPFERLATELIAMVLLDLSNHDIKQLRLTSRTLKRKALLRLNRVFVSANPRNIEVFRAIADHEVFRHQVKEIVWDDTRLPEDVPLTPIQDFEVEQILTEWEKNNLDRFPNPKKITLTAAAHGFLDNPRYETPMIRSFPRGFNYPVPHAWSAELDEVGRPVGLPMWEQDVSHKEWRGFWVIVNEFAERNHRISEFIIETSEYKAGINCRIFEGPYTEYKDLVNILHQPGLRRLDLALLADGQYYCQHREHLATYFRQAQPWSAFRSGFLKKALEELQNPDHVSIRVEMKEYYCYGYLEAHYSRWLPLSSIIPVGIWQKIRHFGLSGFIVDVDELISVLAAQPTTLRSVELSYLIFTEDTFLGQRTGYIHLLEKMRDTLRWRERVKEEMPRVMIHVNSWKKNEFKCLDYFVNDYLYGTGTNLFYNKQLREWSCKSDDSEQVFKALRGAPKTPCYLRRLTNDYTQGNSY